MSLVRPVLLALAALSLPAAAADVQYGLQAQVSAPLGDLKDAVDSKPGIGLGAHLVVGLPAGQFLRPRVDYLFFPKATVDGLMDNTVSDLSAGLDYVYPLTGATGPYLTAGLSANHWRVQADYPGSGSLTYTSTRLGYALGAGYTLNAHVAFELRYTDSQFGRPLLSSQPAQAVQVEALYRF